MILKEALTPGTDMREVLHLNDVVIDFKNHRQPPGLPERARRRREAAVALKKPFHPPVPAYETKGGDIREHMQVTVEDYDLCPRYYGRWSEICASRSRRTG